MGIPFLNRFLQQKAGSGINRVSLNDYRGKKIAVDISIYLYRFMSEGQFIENFYMMMTLMLKYEITPVFIFDGVPPQEKRHEIDLRYARKEKAYEEYCEKMTEYETSSGNKRKALKKELDNLKRQFIKVEKDDIEKVKNLIQSYGLSYYTAKGEADVVCAELLSRGLVDACMSDDMDLFVYGCNKVLRFLSILNATVIEYDLEKILDELEISFEGFKQVCVSSGTDYTSKEFKHDVSVDDIYAQYKEYVSENYGDALTFYEWFARMRGLDEYDTELLNVDSMFALDNIVDDVDNINIYNSPVHSNRLKTILCDNGFIFI